MNRLTQNAPKSFTRRLRSFAQKISLLLATTCICLLLAEFVTRWLFPQFNPGAQLRFQTMPGGFALGPPGQTEQHATPKGDFNVQVKFNQYGFRDVKDLREAADADWFVVGDSYTLGWGIDEEKRYSNLLEQKLQAAGSRARIFNIAIPGNFIDYQRLVKYAESRGAKIRHLIIGVCMDNDLEDYSAGKSDWDLDSQWKAALSTKDKIRRWLRGHSALYITTSFALEKTPLSRRLMEKIGVAEDINVAFGSGKELGNENILKTSRDELVKLASGRDALILIIPMRRLWYGSTMEIDEQAHKTFVQMCHDAGLNVLDLKPVFDKDPSPLSFYFTHDPHWSPRGHEVAAEELLKTIQASEQK